MKTLLIVFILVLTVPAMAEMAIETFPGVTHYTGPNGDTLSVETMPGVRFFSGEVQGLAVEIMPGITHYNLQRRDDVSVDGPTEHARRRDQVDRQVEDHARQMQKMDDFLKAR